MVTNDPKYVTEPILTYYDTKIKEYIDEKTVQPQQELEKLINELTKDTAVNSANIVAHREELDDIESALLVLQSDDKQIREDIADIRVALENIGGTSDVTKDYVDNKIEEALDSLQIPEMPTKISELENDVGYITSKDIPPLDLSDYAKKSDLEELQLNIENKYVTNTTLEQNYVTNESLVNNYTTTKELEATYVTETELSDKVETVIQEKVDSGELTVSADSIKYDTW